MIGIAVKNAEQILKVLLWETQTSATSVTSANEAI